MRLPKTAVCLLTILAASFAFSARPRTAHAQSFYKTYKVQVQYWYFDSDYTYWSTVLETDDRSEAEFVYELLLAADEDGQLNNVVGSSNWRYIAIDVRMTTEYHYPTYVQPSYLNLQPINATRSYFD